MRQTAIVATLVACLLAAHARAGDVSPEVKRNLFWFSIGVGGGFAPHSSGLGMSNGNLGAAYESQNSILAGRYAATEEAGDLGLTEVGVLYGISFRRRVTSLSVAAGIGCVWGDDGHQTFQTLGFPLEAQFTWMPLTFIGLSVDLDGNLNLKLPVGSLGLGLKLGRLR